MSDPDTPLPQSDDEEMCEDCGEHIDDCQCYDDDDAEDDDL